MSSRPSALSCDSPDLREHATVPSGESRFYRPELDILRFFAFFAVFLQHSLPRTAERVAAHGVPELVAPWVAAIPTAGAYGVDLFFVLSAYLITELLQREFNLTGQLDVRAFYVRRILRIWPLYFAFLGGCAVLSLFGIEGEHFGLNYLVAFLLLAGNWICAIQGYPPSVASPLWSVSLEEQFYLSWPLLMRRIRVERLMTAGLGMIVVAFSTRIILLALGVTYPGVWCNTLARLDPIACGIILAAWLKGRKPRFSLGARMLFGSSAVATWLVVARYAPLQESHPVNILIGYPAVALASGLMVVSALACDVVRLPKIVVSPAVYLGRISYGLYVFHAFVIMMFGKVIPLGSPAIRWISSLLGTILLSAISYRWLERPFLRLKLKYTLVQSRPGG